MQPTLIGLAVFLAAFIVLVTRRIEAMLGLTIACSLMGGSAAFSLPSLGGSSIGPAQLGLVFLALRLFLPGVKTRVSLRAAVGENLPILIFAFYSVFSAALMPRMFARQMDVVPMRPVGITHLFDTTPLVPTSQNVTTPFYICGTALFAVCAFMAAREPHGATRVAKTAVIITWIHAITGILSVAAPKAAWGVVQAIFRNGSYAQLDQSIAGFVRIAGIMPEASTYAAFGFTWLVFMTELWLRDVLPRRTGSAAAVMTLVLVCSTSSSAYVSLAAYSMVMVLRLLVNPRMIRFDKMVKLVVGGLMAVTAGCALFVLKPSLGDELATLLAHFTVGKADSASGMQRAFWAKQGLIAFKLSYGLGVGAGSFRSSSIVTAVLGQVGAVGFLSFAFYLIKTFRPLSASTFGRGRDPVDDVGIAASWAAVVMLAPASIAAPSPDPGLIFAFFTGVSLALRSKPAPPPPARAIRRAPPPQSPAQSPAPAPAQPVARGVPSA